jgi:hypothetical protein
MAITKIHAIKSTLGKALAYIENPDKTDGQMLVSGYNCEPQTASIDFEMTAVLAHKARNLKRKRSTNLAYHLIQSFSPEDAVTPEQAHELGKKLAFEYTGGKYEYVVATHIDKGHIHNHIIEKVVEKIRFAVLLCIRRFQTSEKVNSVLCCTALGKQRHDWIPRACQDARKHIAWLQSDARQSAGKGCLSGICRGRETHSYNDRSCRGGNTSTALLCRYGMTLDLLFESVNGNIIIQMRNRP